MPLSTPQQTIVNATQRFKVVIAGRRFGKTHLSVRELCKAARLPEREVWYVAPTYKQAKMIVFKKLRKKLQDLRWVSKINETNMSFELKNGSTISLKGADNYDSLRGVGLDFLVMDEFADIDPEAWFETLRPTLADKMGSALFIGTPKGMNWAKDLYDMAQEYPEEWASFQFTTEQGGNVSLTEIEAARRSLDARTFNQEFRATFETFSGRIFYAFDRKVNVKPYTDPLPKELHLGVDFNIDPMSATISVKTGNILHVFDEFKIFGSNTEELVEEVKTRYPGHTIIAYPDPAGAQRKTSAGGKTDHTILRTANFIVKAPHSHNAVRDGINAVNAKLCSSSGITTLFIDPRCKYLIECLEKQTYKEGTSIPDKDSGFDHMNDSLRYKVDYLFPIKQPTTPVALRRWGHQLG
jgi:hypothetical protein